MVSLDRVNLKLFYYSETCLKQNLNKPESCINQTFK